MKWEDLTIEQRRKIADILAEERLDKINADLKEVKVSNNFYSSYIKRTIDFLVALLALLMTMPINLTIAIITYFDVGSPIFFKQKRIGLNGELFTIAKFRNMRNTYDENGDLLPAHLRVTKFGKFVRRTSLDELLNFWSVLKGDMSLIGPRPLLPQYYHRFNKRHLGRFLVKPGLECPPHIIPNRQLTWQDRFENDVWYVENRSLTVDLKMVINLFKYALDPKMTKVRGEAKMGTFMGYDLQGNAINYQSVEQKYIDLFKD